MNKSELTINPTAIATRIKKRMVELGYSNAAKTARNAGVPYTTFHNWLVGEGKGNFTCDPFLRICIYLKIHPTYILWGRQVDYGDDDSVNQIDTELLSNVLNSTFRHLRAMKKDPTPKVLSEVAARLCSLPHRQLRNVSF